MRSSVQRPKLASQRRPTACVQVLHWANEQGADPRVIEPFVLENAESDRIKASYDHAERLPARSALMQAWAVHLDKLRVGADVIPLKSRA